MKPYIRFGAVASLVFAVGCGRAAAPVVQSSPAPSLQPTAVAIASAAPTVPALPSAIATATPLPAASAVASVPAAPTATPQPANLQYMWPGTLPQGLQIDPALSTAAHDMFSLSLRTPNTQWYADVIGGFTSRASQLPSMGTQPVMVRGQQGAAFSTGQGYSVFWQEGGVPYAVMGSLSLDDTLALANDLAPLGIQGWAASLESVSQASQLPQPPQSQPAALHYLWPNALPQGLMIDAGASYEGGEMFTLVLSNPGTQWFASVAGGASSGANPLPSTGTQPVMVRGQQGAAFSTGQGYSVFWQEGGVPYAVMGSLSLDDTLALANNLGALDHAVWSVRLQQAVTQP